MLNWNDQPHRRYNPLTKEWVLVSPQRTKRPWQGQVEDPAPHARVPYDPACYLCPGNARHGGVRNPEYNETFVFENDFAALRPDTTPAAINDRGLLVAETERGVSRVVCFSPDHSLTLARMATSEIRGVVDVWASQYGELGAVPFIQNVQIFENRGEMMGASNPHPHCQIWANESLPNEIAKEAQSQNEYLTNLGTCLLCDYVALELQSKERIVCENDWFLALTPFWAIWPFEIMLISKMHAGSLADLNGPAREGLADILKRMATRYDNLFQTSFPYSMGIHQKPTNDEPQAGWHLHVHFLPPLLRSATVKKFMVGYELLAMPQRDITAEMAAARLREQPEQHYLDSL
ncbi:MAG: UDP-glucose--hexose-1-phosphate uridylyltransferase [Bryobacteraceae bacterium]